MHAFPRSAMLLAACSLVLVAGCGTDEEPASSANTDPTAGATEPATPDTGTSEPTTPSTPVKTSSAPATLADRLLTTAEVPGLNASWKWQDGETAPAGTGPFGACAKVDLASIGATEVVGRSYFPPVDTDDHADQQVAEFPDAQTAARAAKVLTSWHDQCAAKLRSAEVANVKVGRVTPVPTSVGKGTWYLASWTPKDAEEGRFHAFGTVLDGTRITVLSIDNGGQDYDYPAGKEPMVAMVASAADKLG